MRINIAALFSASSALIHAYWYKSNIVFMPKLIFVASAICHNL
jgi:hypothetical protein